MQINDTKFVYEITEKKLKTKLKVFIYNKDKTTTEFNFDHFLSVENHEGETLKFQSPDFQNFKD